MGHLVAQTFFGHNSPGAWAREVFKPSMDSASRFVLGLGFSVSEVTVGACFCPVYLALGANPTDPFWLLFFWKLGQNPRR